jgi:16S rRNA (cytosine1402-N4)-methyltransferase
MVAEVVDIFRPIPPGRVVDATAGSGGHARALLEAIPQIDVLAIDQDPVAVERTLAAVAGFRDRAVVRHGRFEDVKAVVAGAGDSDVTGVLFDLGVSSPQLDEPARGFSYTKDGPLDMRMDPNATMTAADVVNGYSGERLARVLRRHGDERFARRIAAAIIAARPLESTAALADVVREAIPAPARRHGRHPARRAFQAIRIEVNRELEGLGQAIDDAVDLLSPGGRCVVLTYHSGEDRIVKDRFRRATTGDCTCPPGLPCQCGARPTVRLLTRGARPSETELARNRRAESARLRAVEKLGGEAA